MGSLSSAPFDLAPFWTWFLLFVRCEGMLTVMPGIGGHQVPITARSAIAFLLAVAITLSGASAQLPSGIAEGWLMIATEYLLGVIIGEIPNLILSAGSVGGQLTTGAIGLGQANMIDPSLGQATSSLSLVQTLIATIVFLAIEGHHALIRAAAGLTGNTPIGGFLLTGPIVEGLISKFATTFELAIVVSAPVIVTLLLTQFVLGLVTRFVPQVNVFIVSMPLTVGLGLFIVFFSFPALVNEFWNAFLFIDDALEGVLG